MSHVCTRNEFGVWELKIPNKPDGSSPIAHESRIKVKNCCMLNFTNKLLNCFFKFVSLGGNN